MIEPLTNRQRKWVDDTLASLTLREKIGQTAQERFGGFPDASPGALQAFFSENPLGGLFCGGEIIKGAGNRAKEIREGLALCQRASKVPLLVAGDLESGADSAVGEKHHPRAKSRQPTPSRPSKSQTHPAALGYQSCSRLEGFSGCSEGLFDRPRY